MNRIKWVLASAVLAVVCAPVGAGAQKQVDGTKTLTLHIADQAPGAAELRFFPLPQELTDADAFPLYAKAAKSVPKDLGWEKIKGWRQIPLNQLPLDDIQSILKQAAESLRLLKQASECRRCDWLLGPDGIPSIDLQALRNIVFLIALKARSELVRGDHASCVQTLGTGLALARRLGDGPTVIHVLIGAAAGAVVCGEIELYIQQPGASSLEAAIRAIPKPLVNVQHSDLYGMDLESRSRAQRVLIRANRHVIALQYIETLRLHAMKVGKWPQTLEELKAPLPNDPVTEKPFSYKAISGTQAILEGPLPEGGDARDALRYELNLVK